MNEHSMMKTYVAALSTTALISLAPYALAASSTDLTVTGTITPSACTPLLSNGGMIAHGKVSASNLNQNRFTEIGTHPLQLTVSCDAATQFALNAIDNRPDTSDRPAQFGLGLTDAGEKLGRVEIEIKHATADGQKGLTIESFNNGDTWNRSDVIEPGYLIALSPTYSPPTPGAWKDVVLDLQVRTLIHRADELTLTNDVAIDGSATFEMHYL